MTKTIFDKIKVECPECKKVIFKGKESNTKRLIIYCTDCAQK